ncbi:MAG TPA: 2-oxoacid:acceptor oxidoreductase subunit alpha [Clostridia bacterium]|nr:2-oxoacid:acceptor oxidoreductase subunit alpha [Clostridia bacterium]
MQVGKSRLMQGNEACVEGALAAGVRFFAGYPITPSTEIAELMAERLPHIGGTFIQMEDEIASMAAVIGASLTGTKSLTATSGPGFSLKQENIGFASMAEIPCVIVNVMRFGPSTGMPTSPAQGDVMQARWGTHGDHPIVALSPATVKETYELTIKAINISEEFRVPVILLMDEVVGHMRERVEIADADSLMLTHRPRPTEPPSEYLPYRTTASGVPPMASFGEGYHFHVTGLSHDETGFPSNNGTIVEKMMVRLHEKLESNTEKIVFTRSRYLEDAKIAVVAYGGTARSAEEAVEIARESGIAAGLLQLQTIWPFPDKEVLGMAKGVEKIIVPELNYGQLINEVKRVAGGKAAVKGINRLDGELIRPEEILAELKQVI